MANLDRHIPVSTYRLQFNQHFTFKDATTLIPYLDALGISHCYASPYLQAVPGSVHGYDIVDPTILNSEIGSEEEYEEFVRTLQIHGMGQILDVVPNHMGIARSANPWWQDLLENGPSARHASFFDIDWTPVKPELENKVLLPILGDQYGIVLENQEISLCLNDGQFHLQYFEHQLPLDPSTWIRILTFRIHELIQEPDQENSDLQEFQSIITALSHLPSRNEPDPERITERYREKEVIRRRLAAVCQESERIRNFLTENIRILNGVKGSYRSFDLLDELVSDQAYRLAYWRVASEEINYRRFFDINDLAAIRMEQPEVFPAFHQRIFDLLRSGAVTGLRIDHIDGLFDPKSYLRQWQTWATEELGASYDDRQRSLFIVVEKILGKGESLVDEWPCHGTTGYDFLALVNNLFVDLTHKRTFDDTYSRFIKDELHYEDLLYETKKIIMNSSMSSEINSLGHQLSVLSERNRRSRDFTLNSLIHAVKEIIACFPVYRTYVTQDPDEGLTDRDRLYIRLAVARAKRKNPALSNLVFDFIRDLLLKLPSSESRLDWEEASRFVMTFQQTTSPVTAKSVEDTAFYIYNRLISLNEVGGEPDQFGLPLSTFHERMGERQVKWPHSLSATSTHDTKRGEDVRARINVCSEIPHEWRKRLSLWHRLNKKARTHVEDQIVPDRNEECLIYQTLLGCWPPTTPDDQEYQEFCERIQQYMTKAVREAKVHTSWLNPNEAYESAVQTFVTHILTRPPPSAFLHDFLQFQDKISRYGLYNSLSQVLIKITAPGTPDFYQGTELWDLRLVDPDNRRPVDYQEYQRLLDQMQQTLHRDGKLPLLRALLENPLDARIKLFVTMTALHYRRAHASLFQHGRYHALEARGTQSQHLCAFARLHDNQVSITMAPRYFTSLVSDPATLPVGKAVWEETWVPLSPECIGTQYQDVLTGQIINPIHHESMVGLPLHTVFQHLPLALLERIS